ncbi:22049_t:CDS:2 [Entrophospora sp. SA101]|nr:22049_t:CDS:2 [Entrophospora sp. SA101]CAJ0916093.1 16189_t:CDS:2 [Entrophospora sp. SA101]
MEKEVQDTTILENLELITSLEESFHEEATAVIPTTKNYNQNDNRFKLDLQTMKIVIIVLLDITLEHPDFVKCLAVAHPYVISGSRDETIRIFDIGSEELVDIIEAHYDEVSCLVVKGTMLYSGSLDGTIRKWSITAKDIAERIKKNSIKDDDDKISDSKPSTTTTDTQTSSVMTMEEELELEELLRDDEI